MSLWWASRSQLDNEQVRMIEKLALNQNHIILGPPGSGKTNVLLRRAQYVRSQGMANVLVLSFTRPLTEFVKTGCYDGQKREIFPPALVNTVESWIREIFSEHGEAYPDTKHLGFAERKAFLAQEAAKFANAGKIPKYESIFVDEAQDLIPEEINLIASWSEYLFLVGDDRQRIHDYAPGLATIRAQIRSLNEEILNFHYRLAPELCEMADRIQTATGGQGLAATSHYNGPRPGYVEAHGQLPAADQMSDMASRLVDQLRAYDGLIGQGDLLGIIVPRKDDRETVFEFLEGHPDLTGKSQVMRARGEREKGYVTSLNREKPIVILTEKGSKGLEFRAAHWLFCDKDQYYRATETYYTMVTRPKTRLDLYFETELPATLAKAYIAPQVMDW